MLPGYPIKLTPNNGATRRLALLGFAAACLLPTALPAAEVDANTAEAGLRGQSRFLALAAEQALQAWQPDTALLLSLNALPGAYGGDRPLVPRLQPPPHPQCIGLPDPRRVCGRLCSSGFGYASASRTQPNYLTRFSHSPWYKDWGVVNLLNDPLTMPCLLPAAQPPPCV